MLEVRAIVLTAVQDVKFESKDFISNAHCSVAPETVPPQQFSDLIVRLIESIDQNI